MYVFCGRHYDVLKMSVFEKVLDLFTSLFFKSSRNTSMCAIRTSYSGNLTKFCSWGSTSKSRLSLANHTSVSAELPVQLLVVKHFH